MFVNSPARTQAQAAVPHHSLTPPRRHPLDSVFSPQSVAIIGATEKPNSVGRAVCENLIPFGGRVFPVHPTHDSVLGRQAYPNIGVVPEPVDLAVIVTPAATVPGIVRECVAAKVPAAVILSAGFKEIGKPGVELEQEILAEARRGSLRLVGPNCLGVMTPRLRLNATFAADLARPGNVAFLSQSGALCTALLDWSLKERVGFSAFVSMGSMLDVGWGDLIDYLGDDPHTRSIVCYMESVGDARAFLSAAREVALTKPIIVLKVGRTEAAARAATSHTGAMTGSDAVLDAAFQRAGILRVDTIVELFDMAEVLAKQPRPCGPRLAIVTNAGGPGALSTDMLVRSGGQIASLSPNTHAALDSLLPAHWSHGNPVDILGDADALRYARSVKLVARDPNCDGLLVILTPQKMTQSAATAEALRPFVSLGEKPILASWMGEHAISSGEAILNEIGIPTYRFPDTAARAFALMWRYSDNLRALYERPASDAVPAHAEARPAPITLALSLVGDHRESARTAEKTLMAVSEETRGKAGLPAVAVGGSNPQVVKGRNGSSTGGEPLPPERFKVVRDLIAAARKSNRTLLTEAEAKEILSAYGISTVETVVAHTEGEAVAAASRLGFPVAVKLHSHVITHKTDVGGVQLNLRNAASVRRAWHDIRKGVAARTAGGTITGSPAFLGVTVQRMVKVAAGYELILGSSIDPQFGPVLLFGAGGEWVEVFKDRALGLPPVNATLARRLMEQTRVYKALRGVRGKPPADLAALEQVVVRFSQLVGEQPWIAEIDVNPLLASAGGVVALDARVVLHPPETREADLPRPAIRPYPSQYVSPWKLRDGTAVMIRPIRPEDESLMVKFHHELSERSVLSRYFGPISLEQRVAHDRLARLCFIDYDRELALVVEHLDPASGLLEIIGVGRFCRPRNLEEGEVAITISDRWQRRGLGTELLRRLVYIGRAEGLRRITATILPNNLAMRALGRKMGFALPPAARAARKRDRPPRPHPKPGKRSLPAKMA